MNNVYSKGDAVRCSAQFLSNLGTLVDPDVVNFEIKDPTGVITMIVFPDPRIVKEGTGLYHSKVSVQLAGLWYYRWFSTGAGQAAAENTFTVGQSQF